jgi:hypothetical protein
VVVLLFHSALRFAHLVLFLFKVLIPCAPVVGVLTFFQGAPAVFLREGNAGYITCCRVLVVVPITTFLPSARRLTFPYSDVGTGALLESQWGALGLCVLWRQASYH